MKNMKNDLPGGSHGTMGRIVLTLLKHSTDKLAVSALLQKKEKENLLVAEAMTLKQVKQLFMCDKGKQR